MLLDISKLNSIFKYKLTWPFGALDFVGDGDGKAFLSDVSALLKLSGTRYLKNGVEYLRIDEAKLNIKPKKVSAQFDSLFKGQPELEGAGNQFINDNIDAVVGEIIPQVERAMERKILKVTNSVFARGTFDDFFPLT